jgi:hypothetical protein
MAKAWAGGQFNSLTEIMLSVFLYFLLNAAMAAASSTPSNLTQNLLLDRVRYVIRKIAIFISSVVGLAVRG